MEQVFVLGVCRLVGGAADFAVHHRAEAHFQRGEAPHEDPRRVPDVWSFVDRALTVSESD